MINLQMREYDFYLYGEMNAYGQPTLSKEPVGTVKMSINLASQRVQENILFTGAEYIGLTHAALTDKHVIQFGDIKLKVLYVNSFGRIKQVFMSKM